MMSNHFIITKDWLQEVINTFSTNWPLSPDNPFKNVFFRCKAKCSHCGYTVGYILVAFFGEATIIIWDKDCDTDILSLEKTDWELVDIDALSSKGSTINTLPCFPTPSLDSLSLLQKKELGDLYETSDRMLSNWLRENISKKGFSSSSELTVTEELQTSIKFLESTNLGSLYIKPTPSNLILKVGDVFSPGSGILLILYK